MASILQLIDHINKAFIANNYHLLHTRYKAPINNGYCNKLLKMEKLIIKSTFHFITDK
jgi:hypothetical protein